MASCLSEISIYTIDPLLLDDDEIISKLKLEISGDTEYNLDTAFDDNALPSGLPTTRVHFCYQCRAARSK